MGRSVEYQLSTLRSTHYPDAAGACGYSPETQKHNGGIHSKILFFKEKQKQCTELFIEFISGHNKYT